MSKKSKHSHPNQATNTTSSTTTTTTTTSSSGQHSTLTEGQVQKLLEDFKFKSTNGSVFHFSLILNKKNNTMTFRAINALTKVAYSRTFEAKYPASQNYPNRTLSQLSKMLVVGFNQEKKSCNVKVGFCTQRENQNQRSGDTSESVDEAPGSHVNNKHY